MNFHIITLFPEAFSSYLNESILARAIKEKKVKVSFYNPRDFAKVTKAQKAKNKPYKRVDDIPYGGGPGMVMQTMPVVKAIEKALSASRKSKVKSYKVKIIFLSPGGKQFDTAYAKNIAQKYTDVIIVSGRYEGIDERVREFIVTDEISIGDYVLSGGELAAMVVVNTVVRLLPGFLGSPESLLSESHTDGLLEYPQYTRPPEFHGWTATDVLLSGNHAQIARWRQEQSIIRTKSRRPDMIKKTDY